MSQFPEPFKSFLGCATTLTTDLPVRDAAATRCLREHFSTQAEGRSQQLLSWRNRLGHFLDVPISRAQMSHGFYGTIDMVQSADLRFSDSRTDAVSQTRSPARISTDTSRNFVFHVLMEGKVDTTTGLYPKRRITQSVPGILALDLGQPMHMERTACHVLAFFLPRTLLNSVLPAPESIHGNVIGFDSPVARMIPSLLASLCQNLRRTNPSEAYEEMRVCALLIAAAFGKDARLTGSARSAARAATFSTIRRYITANLNERDLTPESVLRASQLSRPTLYRLFENEGGLATYIRNCRLREAAEELRRSRHKAVVDVAYESGFNSAADFNHAFRRAYDMAPLDFRWFSLPEHDEPVATSI